MSQGKLTLIPTPLNNSSPLHSENLNILKEACLNPNKSIFLLEEPKSSRRRWIAWGLDRSFIDNFRYFNEHNQIKDQSELLAQLRNGKNIYLISDEGIPVFCDPGAQLVNACHEAKIKVDCGVFCNSLMLALALSGFNVDSFHFMGFPPLKNPDRSKWFKDFCTLRSCNALMDTAYRLTRVLSDIENTGSTDRFFLACDLNRESQLLLRGNISSIIKNFDGGKRDFVLIKQSYVRNNYKKR